MVPMLQTQDKEQLVVFISWATEVGVPTGFCLYFWQSQYRNSLIHFKHIIILRNLPRLEMEKPEVRRTCWADITCPACDQHRGDCGTVASTGSPVAAGWSLYMYIRKGTAAARRKKWFWGLPYMASAYKVHVYSALLVKPMLVVLAVTGNEWALVKKALTVGCDSVQLSYRY